MSYDDWKTDPDYGKSHRDLREEELQQQLRAAQDENTAQQAKIDNLTDMLEEILDWCKDNQDVVDGDDGQPQPDKIMRMGTAIEEVLGRGGRYGR